MRFSRRLYRIAINNIPYGRDPHRDAFISDCGLFAVHRNFGSEYYYTLTHLPTGHAIAAGDFETAKKARDFCKAIHHLTDWSKVNVKLKKKHGITTSYTRWPKGVSEDALGQQIKKIREDYL